MVGRLSSAVAHEIRNPVAIIAVRSPPPSAPNLGDTGQKRDVRHRAKRSHATRKTDRGFSYLCASESGAAESDVHRRVLGYVADIAACMHRKKEITIYGGGADAGGERVTGSRYNALFSTCCSTRSTPRRLADKLYRRSSFRRSVWNCRWKIHGDAYFRRRCFPGYLNPFTRPSRTERASDWPFHGI